MINSVRGRFNGVVSIKFVVAECGSCKISEILADQREEKNYANLQKLSEDQTQLYHCHYDESK